MKVIKARGVAIGAGIPKICVPIVGKTKSDIIKQANNIIDADIIEWRADWYEDIFCYESAKNIGNELRNIFPDKPLLFTFRTKEEGGEKEITDETYEQMNLQMAESGFFDLIDIEMFRNKERVRLWINQIHKNHCYVIGSNHDFTKTPAKEEIINRFKTMETFSVDIAKIAVMPTDKIDVLHFMQATLESEKQMDIPIIAMSMGKEGVISRLLGEWCGSAVTFGSSMVESAPGQVKANILRDLLECYHSVL